MASVLWVSLLVGRLLAATAYRHQRPAPLVVGSSTLATGVLATPLLAGDPVVAVACFLLGGVGFSAIYPVVVVIAGQWYRNDQGLAIRGFSSFLFPFAMSALAEGLRKRPNRWPPSR